jgi:hypothetical protein
MPRPIEQIETEQLEQLIAICKKRREEYPFAIRQYGEITAQIQRLQSSLDYLTLRDRKDLCPSCATFIKQ